MSLVDDILAVLAAGEGDVVIEPPGVGDGYWAGAPSAITVEDGIWLAYRLRRPVGRGRGYANVIAHSTDGIHFETVATVTSEQFDSDSLERPALVPLPDGGWRLFVSCAAHSTKHWWVETVDAATPQELPQGKRTVVLPGDAATTAWKDIVVHPPHETPDNGGTPGTEGVAAGRLWQLWACRHPLDGGDDEADRMSTHYFTSTDGLDWDDHGPALLPRAGEWDSRGARVTSVLHTGAEWLAFYDGRASAAENWYERSGVASGATPDRFTAIAGPTPPGRTARYVSVARVAGGVRLYWEASRSDGSNDLRTAYVPRPLSPSQS